MPKMPKSGRLLLALTKSGPGFGRRKSSVCADATLLLMTMMQKLGMLLLELPKWGPSCRCCSHSALTVKQEL